jgi:hypothetical protein
VGPARKLKTFLRRAALIWGLLLCSKAIWFAWMAPAATTQDGVKARADIDMRRAYLMFGLSPAATGFVRARWFVGTPGSSPERSVGARVRHRLT